VKAPRVQPPPMSDRRDRALLAAVVSAVLLAQTLLYPGVDLLTTALSGDGVAAPTLFLAVEFAAFALLAGPWGRLSDRLGRRIPFVAAAAGAGAIVYVALATVPRLAAVPTFPAALALRALQGALVVGAFTLAMSTLADLGGGNGRNMGAAGVAVGVGTAVGAPLGGQLYEVGPFAPLWAAAGLLAVVAVAVALVPDRAPAPDDGGDHGLRALAGALRRRSAMAVPYAFGFADRFTAGFFALAGTLYFRSAFGASAGETGVLLAAFFAPFALLQYPFGRLSDRVGRVAPVVAGSATYGLAVVAVGLAPSLRVAAAGMVLVGVLGALMAPATLALVVDLAEESERGVAVAGFNAAGSLGFLAGALLGGGLAATAPFPVAFAVAGGVELLLAAAALPALLRMELPREAVFG